MTRALAHATMALGLLVAVLMVGSSRGPVAAAPVAAAPSRIISLVPAVTEMVFAIGAGHAVMGVSSYDHFPAAVESLPRVGGLLDPNIERIIAMRPDLVVVYATQADLRRQLDAAGIPQYVYVHKGLAAISAVIRDLGVRLAAPGAEAAASRLDADLAAVRARVAGRARPRVLVVFGREPGSLRNINASGGVGFLHDMLVTAGGVNVLADVTRESVQIGAESVLSLKPDIIIELHYGAGLPTLQADRERAVWNSLGSLPAVRSGRVHLVAGNQFVVPGPRIVDAVRTFADLIHPDTH